MKDKLEAIYTALRAKTRAEHLADFKSYLAGTREFAKNNGEISTAAAFIVGLAVALAFKVVLLALAICLTIFAIVFLLSKKTQL